MIITLLDSQDPGEFGKSFDFTIQGYPVTVKVSDILTFSGLGYKIKATKNGTEVTSDNPEYVALQDKLISLGEDSIVSESDIIASLAKLNVGDSVTIKTTLETDLMIGEILFNTRLDKKVEQANAEIDALLEQLTATEDD